MSETLIALPSIVMLFWTIILSLVAAAVLTRPWHKRFALGVAAIETISLIALLIAIN